MHIVETYFGVLLVANSTLFQVVVVVDEISRNKKIRTGAFVNVIAYTVLAYSFHGGLRIVGNLWAGSGNYQ